MNERRHKVYVETRRIPQFRETSTIVCYILTPVSQSIPQQQSCKQLLYISTVHIFTMQPCQINQRPAPPIHIFAGQARKAALDVFPSRQPTLQTSSFYLLLPLAFLFVTAQYNPLATQLMALHNRPSLLYCFLPFVASKGRSRSCLHSVLP